MNQHWTLNKMQINIEGHRLSLAGQIHFENVSAILEIGIQAIQAHPNLEIDLEHLLHSDSSACALFIEWLRKAQAQDRALHFLHIPQFMQNIATVYGLKQVLAASWEN